VFVRDLVVLEVIVAEVVKPLTLVELTIPSSR
jgi:hypothetical protein